MDTNRQVCRWKLQSLLISAAFLVQIAYGLSTRQRLVVEARNITMPAGSQAVLPCHSPGMVWIRDRLKDRQRVVHWDLVRSVPEHSVERVIDMSPGVPERVYHGLNKGRITIPKSAFSDGNFSLVINNVGMNDQGTYSCNLHHHYCKMHQSINVQLNVTKSPRKEKRFWDGEKTVFVVLLGSSVLLPCVNRRPVWTEGLKEENQQVAHWDWQPPRIRPDAADRLVDLYASGERRQYGPHFLRDKMRVSDDAFSLGDFSLTISDLQLSDRGLYSCHLHHHYCGLHERRVFRLIVGPPLPPVHPATPTVLLKEEPSMNVEEEPRVVNVIVPEHQGHFTQQVAYILATFVLLAIIVTTIIVLTQRHRKRGREYDPRGSERGHVTPGDDFSLDDSELKTCNHDNLNQEHKNNMLKAREELSKTEYYIKEPERVLWK